jgi:hypothetical protein
MKAFLRTGPVCRYLMSSWLAVGLFLGTTSQSGAQQQFGVGIHNRDSTVGEVEKYVAPIGLSLRGDLSWRDTEQSQGQLQIPSKDQKVETLMKTAGARGVKPIVVLAYGNQFYDKGDLIKSQEGYQAYIRYASYVVRELKGSVNLFEIWNEWNLNTGSQIKPKIWGDAGSYVNLLKTVYPALKSGNHDAVLIGGVVGGTDDRWIDRFISEGGLAYVDGFSVHPYVYRHVKHPKAPVMVSVNSTVASNGGINAYEPGTPEEAIAWIDQLAVKIKAGSAGRSVPIYVSEIGWPTSTDPDGVPDDVAAAYLQRFMLLAHCRQSVAGVWWYDLQDDDVDPSNVENRFGLLQQNGQPKPAYTALAQIQHMLRSAKLLTEGDPSGMAGQIAVTGRTDDGKDFVAAWLSTSDMKKSEKWNDYSKLSHSGFQPMSSNMASGTLSATPVILIR